MAATEHSRPNILDRIDALAIRALAMTRDAASWWSDRIETPICAIERRRENRSDR